MTWEKLVNKWREPLQDAGGGLIMMKEALVKLTDDGDGPGNEETLILLTVLTRAVVKIHSACESIAIGVDALAMLVHDLTAEEETGDEEECPF